MMINLVTVYVLITIHMLISVDSNVISTTEPTDEDDNIEVHLPEDDLTGIIQILAPHHEENSKALHSGNMINAEELCHEDDVACFRRHERLEEFKMGFLDKLNIQSPPNITADDHPSQITINSLLKHYGVDRTKEDADRVTTKDVIVFPKPFSAEDRNNGERGCYFGFADEERTFTAQKAVLWMYVKADDDRVVPDTTYVNFFNYKKYRNGSVHAVAGPRRHVRVTETGGHWQPIDVHNYVNKWLDDPNEDGWMKIIAEDNSILAVDVAEDNSPFKPYMQVTLMKTPSQSRSKRDVYPEPVSGCDSEYKDLHCCKFDFEINFRQTGWKWIIYPESYNARYCAGACAYQHHQKSLHNKLLYMAQDDRNTKILTCCTPKSLNAISVLYYDNLHNIVYSNLDGMKIRECHCN